MPDGAKKSRIVRYRNVSPSTAQQPPPCLADRQQLATMRAIPFDLPKFAPEG